MWKINILVVFFLLLVHPELLEAKRLKHENLYATSWCEENKGVTEVTLSSRARCDCLTETHAIEFDFANKWAESIGQSLHYSSETKKKAGVVLIMEYPKAEGRFLARLLSTVKTCKLPIDIWLIAKGNRTMQIYEAP